MIYSKIIGYIIDTADFYEVSKSVDLLTEAVVTIPGPGQMADAELAGNVLPWTRCSFRCFSWHFTTNKGLNP